MGHCRSPMGGLLSSNCPVPLSSVHHFSASSIQFQSLMPSQAPSDFLCLSLAISFSFVPVRHHSVCSAAGLIYSLGTAGAHKNVFLFIFFSSEEKMRTVIFCLSMQSWHTIFNFYNGGRGSLRQECLGLMEDICSPPLQR